MTCISPVVDIKLTFPTIKYGKLLYSTEFTITYRNNKYQPMIFKLCRKIQIHMIHVGRITFTIKNNLTFHSYKYIKLSYKNSLTKITIGKNGKINEITDLLMWNDESTKIRINKCSWMLNDKQQEFPIQFLTHPKNQNKFIVSTWTQFTKSSLTDQWDKRIKSHDVK